MIRGGRSRDKFFSGWTWCEDIGRNSRLVKTAQIVPCNSQLGTQRKRACGKKWRGCQDETLKKLLKTRISKIPPEPQWHVHTIFVTLFLWPQHSPAALSAPKPTCRTTSPMSSWGHGGAAGHNEWHWMGFPGSHWNFLSEQLWQIRLAVQWLVGKVMQMYEWVTAPLGRKSYFRPARVTAIAEHCQLDNKEYWQRLQPYNVRLQESYREHLCDSP